MISLNEFYFETLCRLRRKAINHTDQQVLISNFSNTLQERDLTELPNCGGYGRIHHFNMRTSLNWPENPLPNLPASKALNKQTPVILRAEIFQLSICNLNCWYCFVPKELRDGNLEHAKFLSVQNIVSRFLKINDKPKVIILSGGQPDLAPEWLYWMMVELKRIKIDEEFYLWSDDNLTTDFFFNVLTSDQINYVKSYQNYGKVGCFKGFDQKSFIFNTRIKGIHFQEQFNILQKYIDLNIDVYSYVTLTAPDMSSADNRIRDFISKLQEVRYYLPLRTIPLEIKNYSPLDLESEELRKAMKNQHEFVKIWNDCLKERYSKNDIKKPITEIDLNQKN